MNSHRNHSDHSVFFVDIARNRTRSEKSLGKENRRQLTFAYAGGAMRRRRHFAMYKGTQLHSVIATVFQRNTGERT